MQSNQFIKVIMQRRFTASYRHTDHLLYYYTNDEASHTQTHTNKTPKEIKEKGNTFLGAGPSRPARPGRIAAKMAPDRAAAHSARSARPFSSSGSAHSARSGSAHRALLTRRLSWHEPFLLGTRRGCSFPSTRHGCSWLPLSSRRHTVPSNHRPPVSTTDLGPSHVRPFIRRGSASFLRPVFGSAPLRAPSRTRSKGACPLCFPPPRPFRGGGGGGFGTQGDGFTH